MTKTAKPRAARTPLRSLLIFVLALAAPSAAMAACSPQASAARTVAVPAGAPGFGTVQGLPPLPLEAGEYVVTIDDGPDPNTTEKLAEILRDRCVKATFFFIGWKAGRYPEIVRSVLAMGHRVGSHSFSHHDFGPMTEEQRLDELERGMKAVDAARGDGTTSDLVRVPGSSGMPAKLPKELVEATSRQGLVIAGYDISPEDWRNSPPEESLARLRRRLGDRGVIVFHDGQSNTLGLLPEALDELQKRNAIVVDLHG